AFLFLHKKGYLSFETASFVYFQKNNVIYISPDCNGNPFLKKKIAVESGCFFGRTTDICCS
ncbi:hypothetical protein, partial [Kaistella sp.]|uniref:hypothetical protein n=1 Tax=Kaistella sp. TaxID=2782235 RepID=UPI002F94E7B2